MKGLWKSKLNFIDGGKHSYSQRRKKASKNQHKKDNILHYRKFRKNRQNKYGFYNQLTLRVLIYLSGIKMYNWLSENKVNKEETIDISIKEGYSELELKRALLKNSIHSFNIDKCLVLSIKILKIESVYGLIEANFDWIDNYDIDKLSKLDFKKSYSSLRSKKKKKTALNRKVRRNEKQNRNFEKDIEIYFEELYEYYD